MRDEEIYDLYVRMYGMLKTGAQLTPSNYGYFQGEHFVSYDQRRKVAISLAAQDVKEGNPIRTKAGLEQEVSRLVGGN